MAPKTNLGILNPGVQKRKQGMMEEAGPNQTVRGQKLMSSFLTPANKKLACEQMIESTSAGAEVNVSAGAETALAANDQVANAAIVLDANKVDDAVGDEVDVVDDDSDVATGAKVNFSALAEIAVATANEIVAVETDCNIFSNDIGNHIGQKINDTTKKHLLENPWTPPHGYNFPFSKRSMQGKEIKHYVNQKHLDVHKDWLVLSHVKRGLFCKFCPWFTIRNEAGFRNNVALGVLVKYPLLNFKKLTGADSALHAHSNTNYHKNSVAAGKDFLKAYNNYSKEISNMVNAQHLSQVQENRLRIIPIIKTVLLLGRQNMPFRGHRDDGPLLTNNDEPVINEGNFRALLRFRIDAGDTILEEHLKNTTSRATYISKTVQNQLIEIAGNIILKEVLQRLYNAKFYSIMFDETTDLSGKAQVSLLLRYIDVSGKPCIREDFVSFIDAFGELTSENYDDDDKMADEICLSGSSIAKLVLNALKKINVDIHDCVAIGTDSCPAMMGEIGAVKEIQKHCVNATVSPCFSHKLNNTISKSSNVAVIKSSFGIMREVTKFFKTSKPKRNTVLLNFLGKKIVQLCDTRWVERHDSVLQFATQLSDIVAALEKIGQWRCKETADKANILIAAVCKTEFLISLFCLSDVLTVTQPLSVMLQSESMDLGSAADLIKSLMEILENRRRHADEYFKIVYSDAKKMAESLNIEMQRPRTCRKQLNRNNHDVLLVSDYYRVSVYIPLLDTLTADLQSRFSSELLNCFKISALFPAIIVDFNASQIQDLSDCIIGKFGKLLEGNTQIQKIKLRTEVEFWQIKWKEHLIKKLELPTSAFSIFLNCDKAICPTIHKLLHLLCTLPATNASAERTFSTLRRMKTWLRTTMLQSRLTGLALLNIHHDIECDPEEVLNIFSKCKNHRLTI